MPTVPVQKYCILAMVERGFVVYPCLREGFLHTLCISWAKLHVQAFGLLFSILIFCRQTTSYLKGLASLIEVASFSLIISWDSSIGTSHCTAGHMLFCISLHFFRLADFKIILSLVNMKSSPYGFLSLFPCLSHWMPHFKLPFTYLSKSFSQWCWLLKSTLVVQLCRIKHARLSAYAHPHKAGKIWISSVDCANINLLALSLFWNYIECYHFT